MPARKDTATRQLEIYATAEQFFRQKGYLATNMREIAGALGVRGASLYSHISGKEDILWRIAARAADEFFAALAPIAAAPDLAPLKLRRAIVAHVGVIAAHPAAAAVYLNEWRHLGARRRAHYTRRRDDYEALFRTIVSAGMQAGDFEKANEKIATRMLLSALNATHQWYRPDGLLTAGQVGERLADMLLNGLARRSSPRP